MRDAAQSDSASLAAARSQKALESLRQQQRELQDNGSRSIEKVAQNLAGLGGDLLQKQRALQEELSDLIQSQGMGQTRREASRDSELQSVTNSQQQQQRDLEDIEDMLRAVIARGDSDDQRLLSRAQSAVRELRPIRNDMQTSNRVLRNGMANLAADMEAELEEKIESFAQSLADLDPRVTGQNPNKAISEDAELLQAVVQGLEAKVAAYNADALSEDNQNNTNQPSLSEMREQLAQAQGLAESLSRQLTQQSQNGGVGEVQQGNGNQELGNARSVRQELTRSKIEDFLAQPELLRALIDPIVQLSGALRARAELESVGEKLFLELDKTVPTEYRDLVKEYYKALSEVEPSETGAF
jgi:phosphohistidine phosphatase SixA